MKSISGVVLILILFLVPGLITYDLLYQWSTPTMDFLMDNQGTSTVSSVVRGGLADRAGLQAGDVIQTVDAVPFSRWNAPQSGRIHVFSIERKGISQELPVQSIRLLQMNIFPFAGTVIISLVFWAIGSYLLFRKFWNDEVQLIFLLFQLIPTAIIFPLSFQIPWVFPSIIQDITKSAASMIAPVFLSYTLTHPSRLGNIKQRIAIQIIIYGFMLFFLWAWITGKSWGQSSIISFTSIIFSLAVVFLSYSYLYRVPSESRRKIRVAFFCLIASVTPLVLFYIIPRTLGATIYLPIWIACLFFIITPVGYLFATLYFNLYGIDRIINRTLVYGVVSLGIFIIYLIPYGFLFRYLPTNPYMQIVVVFSYTIWIGWTFDWLRSRAQRIVDRLVYGGWYDFPNVVETISNALSRSTTRNQIKNVLTIQLSLLMRLSGSSLIIGGVENEKPDPPGSDTSFRYLFKTDIPASWIVISHTDGDDLSDMDHRILNTLAQQAEIALNNAIAIEQLQNQLDEIRASREILSRTQHQLLRSREEERSRLARDLHDSPIQSLIGMNIQAGLLLTQKKHDASTTRALSEMRGEIRQVSDELRQICADLRPPMLDALGLSSALHSLAIEWSKQSGIKMELDLCEDSQIKELPGEVTVNLYRVAQEALSNIAKHSGAKVAKISLLKHQEEITLSIEDDGIGFKPPDTLQGLTSQSHFGLAGMRERINLIGGLWSVESIPQKGTKVRVVWNKNGETDER